MSGGYSKYLLNVLPKIASDPVIDSVLCAFTAAPGMKTRVSPHPKINFCRCEPFRFMRHRPDPGLKRALDEFRPDVLFIPLERHIKYNGLPVVTMIQNMAPLVRVKTTCGFVEKLKSSAQYLESRIAVKNADRVIAPTNFVKDFLIENWSIAPEKISLIYYGANPSLKKPDTRPPASMRGFAGRFILTAGSIEPYRGLEDIILALSLLKQKGDPARTLAIAGECRARTVDYCRMLKKLADSHDLEQNILWLGKLNDSELGWCYDNCSAFIMTSRVESFGMPALEAMSYGCNCISTDSPCLPEIFGTAALYYKAHDHKALAELIARVLNRDAGERLQKGERAATRALEFSWDKTARETVLAFENAIKRHYGSES